MKKVLFKISKEHITRMLFVMCLFCFSLSMVRAYFTSINFYFFLNFNLFLSFIPWLISSIILKNMAAGKNILWKGILIMIWLLFFPNSLYIFTDLFHLRRESTFPIWYDFILITSFAWTGFMFGLISLLDIEKFLINFFSQQKVNVILILLLFLGSFGVYIGRYLRWNSWDIVLQPTPLLTDISDRVQHPFTHKGTWAMTLLLGVLLNIIFWSIRMIRNRKII